MLRNLFPMSSRYKKKRENRHSIKALEIVTTSYTSAPVPIPDSFLAPLSNPSAIKVERIDFANSKLPSYEKLYAVVLDNVLSQRECDQLIHMAEQSAGAHGSSEIPNNGWIAARVNAGMGQELMMLDYRNSDRIIWDNKVLAKRLWDRVLQGQGMAEYLSALDGESYAPVFSGRANMKGGSWVATQQGLNERMRFLKYGADQFFKPHCDSCYETSDGSQLSFYTIQLYLNDSVEALGTIDPSKRKEMIAKEMKEGTPAELIFGGATTFHSTDMRSKLDVHPKAGRVLIFQQKGLLHSGDFVVAGMKYTMRSDVMYERIGDVASEFSSGQKGNGEGITDK